MPSSKNKNNEDSTGKNIAAVIICLLLIVRGAQGIQKAQSKATVQTADTSSVPAQYKVRPSIYLYTQPF